MGRVFKALNKADFTSKNDVFHDPQEIPALVDAALLSAVESAATSDLFQDEPTPTEPDPGPSASAVEEPTLFLQDETGPAAAPGWDERIVAVLGTASAVAEEFRRLRTHILHPPAGGKPARTILVVSAMPEEGKTFVCAGLAITLAQGVEGHALLIDCDLRRPSLAAMFGLGNEKGLSDHLRTGVDLGGLICKTDLRKLSIIPSGLPPANPAELLGSEKLAAMVNEVAERYPDRYILFDSPPLRKAAETSILAKQVDGVVLVVRDGKSRREDVRQLIETIGPEKIIGVVFNAYQTNQLERGISGSHCDDYYSSYHKKSAVL